MHARVHFQITGAQTVDFTADTALNIYVIFGKDVPPATYFLSVSEGQPVALPNGMQLVYDVADLTPGLYNGPGKYTLAPQDTKLGHGVLSSASVVQFSSRAGYLRRYNVLTEPCTLVVTAEQRHGDMRCPKLSAADGSSIATHIVWDLT